MCNFLQFGITAPFRVYPESGERRESRARRFVMSGRAAGVALTEYGRVVATLAAALMPSVVKLSVVPARAVTGGVGCRFSLRACCLTRVLCAVVHVLVRVQSVRRVARPAAGPTSPHCCSSCRCYSCDSAATVNRLFLWLLFL